MSIILGKLQRTDPLAKLHLRMPNGEIRGSFTVADLCKLATQNRIPPGSQVSDDTVEWVPAELVEALKLEWDAKCADGRTLGPFNLLAIPLLVQDGSLVAGDIIVNRISNRSVLVRDLLKPGATVVRKSAAAQGSATVAGDATEASTGQRELFAAPQLSSETTPAVDASMLSRALERPAGQRRRAVPKESENGSRMASLKESLEVGVAALADAKAALDHEKALHAETRRLNEQEARQLKERVKVLESEHRDISARLADSVREANKARQTEEALKTDSRSREAELVRRNAELEKALNHSAAETVKVKAILEQEKALHAEMRHTTGAQEQQSLVRIKELETEARSLSSRLAQASRGLEELTQKSDAAQAEGRRKEAEAAQRIEQLERNVNAGSSEIAKLKADHDYEKAMHAETRRLGSEKEKQFAGFKKEMEKEIRDLSTQQQSAQQVSAEARQKEEALQLESRKKDVDTAQRIEQLRRSLEAKVADGTRLKAELDREKALHVETRRLDGEREQQLVGRIKELEIKAREASARMVESIQLAEERKRKYEAIQQDSRYKEGETTVRVEHLAKSTEGAAKAVREIQQKMEEEQAAHVLVQKEGRKKEQELTERIARMETEAGILAGVVSQTRVEAEKQKTQDQNVIDQLKAREIQSTQRISQLQSDHEQIAMALEQARKKLAEKRMTPAPAQDPAVSEREKRLTLTLTQMEKQTASSTALMEQAKAETERLRKELIRTNERLSSTEIESRARIDELERMTHAAALSAEAAKKVIEEQSRLSKRLTEENAALSSRQPGLQAEIQNLTAAAQNSQQELAAARLMLDEATTALTGERKWREKAAEESVVERKKLEARIDRMQQEPARIEKRANARRRIVAYVRACGIAFVAGLVVRGLVGSIAVRARGVADVPAIPAASRSAASTNSVKRSSVIAQTNIASSHAVGRAATGGVQTVAVSLPIALKWPDVAVDGIVVTKTNRSMVMVFKYGTFSSMAVLKDRARKDLGVVAGRLKNRMNEFYLIVVGHTDTVPVGTNTVSGGNYELGMARARAVTSYLAKDCGLPAESLVAESAGGGSDTPYNNTDEDSRQKNRTVVLKLIPFADAAARKP